MANMRRSRTGDWSVVIGPGPTVHFFYIFSFSSLVRVVANLRRCLHYHISDHISTEGGHAEHVLVTGTRWMPHLLTNKFLRFRRCPVTFAQ